MKNLHKGVLIGAVVGIASGVGEFVAKMVAKKPDPEEPIDNVVEGTCAEVIDEPINDHPED